MRPVRPELDGTYPHHPDCPGCAHDRKLDDAIRSVEGLRRARVRDDTIRLALRGWYPDWMVSDALEHARVAPTSA